MPRGTPTLEEVLAMALEAKLASVNISLPGKVESYDADSQTADIRPMVRRLVPGPTGETEVPEDLPVIPKVKITHPGGANWSIHVPLAVGDVVLLVFSQVDPSEFFRTNQLANPADHRRFHLAHAVAIPGLRTDGAAITGANGSDIQFRHSSGFTMVLKASGVMEVGGSSDAAALASKVEDLADFVYSHAHTFVGTGTVTVPIAGTVPAGPYPRLALGSVASAKLKVGS